MISPNILSGSSYSVRDNGGVPVLVVPHDIYEGSWTDLDSYYGKIDPELFADDPGESSYSGIVSSWRRCGPLRMAMAHKPRWM